jgi:hypothetical protein
MPFVRYALPGIVVVGGMVVMALGGANELEGGAGIVSAGLAIYFINWLFRIGVQGEDERDAEERARAYFDSHGHWPGEGPSADGPKSRSAATATASAQSDGVQATGTQTGAATTGAAGGRGGSAPGRAARAPRRR